LAKGDIADGHTLKIWDDERRVSLSSFAATRIRRELEARWRF